MNCSLTPQPQLLYEMPVRPKAEKIEDSLLCQCPLVSATYYNKTDLWDKNSTIAKDKG